MTPMTNDPAALSLEPGCPASRSLDTVRAGNSRHELSAREREVLEHVAAGLSNAEIGSRLGLAGTTIKHYMTNILGKLYVNSRVEAALIGYRARNSRSEPGS